MKERKYFLVGSLFTGIGGFDLGLQRNGFEIAWQIENDKFCNKVLEKRFPHVARWSDVRKWKSNGHEHIDIHAESEKRSSGNGPPQAGIESARNEAAKLPIDLLVGGFPCQDLSVAGKRKGISGERSGLFWEIVRIAKAIKPTWGLFENVPGLFSSNRGRDMAEVLQGLRQCWPVVSYRVLDSRHWGVAQRRRRVFFVCGPSERSVEEVLFEQEGSTGGFETSKKERSQIAASLRSRSHKAGPPGAGGGEDDMNLVTALRHLGSGGPDDNEAQGGHLVSNGVGVRRLTPTECERLQGFSDGWTCLCDLEPCICPDSPRYRALGNAVTVNVIKWLGERIMARGKERFVGA